ncbi:hypothetical protein LPJ64_003999 [Coemansia asiatica]|uniref:Uncharacterized protein n=1 Tax=Coemansia asiatica TaxID=1052880 RepID=A0A9W7XJ74_9FUNG|nr:hypothetical protein LPJ64_003999 [Coemansia asiatica]
MSAMAVCIHDLTSWSWQSQLNLLAVCRQWREIAQPHVFGTCFIKLREEYNYDSDDVSDSDSDQNYVFMDTNIDRIVANGDFQWTKTMHIVLLWPFNPLAYISEIINKLETKNADWSSVAKLTIWLTSSTFDKDTEMPKNEPIDNAVKEAAHVSLLSQVHAGSLKSIVLSNLSSDFTWRYFIGDGADGKNDITFHQLETLSLSYAGQLNSKYRVNSTDHCCLHFPRLKNLAIQNFSEHCEILHAKTYLQKMQSISIAGAFSAIRALAKMDIVSVDSLIISITTINDHDYSDGFYEATNRLFGKQLISYWSKLATCPSNHLLDPRLTSWHNLSELNCHDSIEFNSLVELVSRLPRTRKLRFAQITFANEPLDIVKESVFSKELVDPLDTRLEDLYLFINTDVYPMALAAVKYLVVRTPLLKQVYLPQDVHLAMEKFVKRAQFEYRHLSKVKIGHAFSPLPPLK